MNQMPFLPPNQHRQSIDVNRRKSSTGLISVLEIFQDLGILDINFRFGILPGNIGIATSTIAIKMSTQLQGLQS